MFFSGFCLSGEEGLFSEYFDSSSDAVCGFSYGAQKAFSYSQKNPDIKRLILLSPAFYMQKTDEFREAQIGVFADNPELYRLKLLKKSGFAADEMTAYQADGTADALRELLYFRWDNEELNKLAMQGVQIEVYIGSKDGVVEPKPSYEFFKNCGLKTVWLENKNHILR